MQHQRGPTADPDIEAWHWLVDAIAAEIAAGTPHDPRVLIARIAARLPESDPDGLDAYLPAMFTDPG